MAPYNRTTVDPSIMPVTKNGKLQPHRQFNSLSSRSANSSATSTPRLNAPPTSAPQIDAVAKAQEKGMRTVVVHLLATRPASEQDIASKTRIPRSQLAQLLPKIADKDGNNWSLSNKSYKEIDPWTFNYTTPSQRECAISNAIRAFDRIRIGKEEKIWQILLPKEERGKGKVLSKLHLNVEQRDQQVSPGLAPTPVHRPADKADPSSLTPNAAAASTPRNGAVATGRSASGISIEKRLKDAKKKQELEKKKMAKERDVASDRESKPRETKPRASMKATATTTAAKRAAAKPLSGKIKSAERVHDSDDDDEEGEITEPSLASQRNKRLNATAPSAASKNEKPLLNNKQPVSEKRSTNLKPSITTGTPSSKARPSSSQAEGSADTQPVKRDARLTNAATTSTPKAAVAAKQANAQRPVKSSSSAVSSDQRPHTRPKIPSPLGTTKPRNASEEADPAPKSGNSSRLSKTATSSSAAAASKTLPKQADVASKTGKLPFFGEHTGRPGPVIKKRPLEQADIGSDSPRKAAKVTAGSTAKSTLNNVTRASANDSPLARPANDNTTGIKKQAKSTTGTPATDSKLKAKANDLSSGLHDHAPRPTHTHHKTDSSSTHSADQRTASSLTSLTTAPTTSPSPSPPPPSPNSARHTPPAASSSHPRTRPHNSTDRDIPMPDVIQMFLNDAEASPKTQSTWESALDKAAKFRTQLYPAYAELFDKLERTPPEEVDEEDRRTLFMLHSKLKAYKKAIFDAVG